MSNGVVAPEPELTLGTAHVRTAARLSKAAAYAFFRIPVAALA